MAAVLACGPDAVLSHRAAIALWELRPTPSAKAPIDVTVPGRTRKGREGIRVHNVRKLHDDDRARVDGIPVTSVHRTLLDYAEAAGCQQLRLAIEAAERRDLLDGRRLKQLYARSRGRRGLEPLTEATAELRGPAPWTQSELERAFLALIRDAAVPEPQANVLVQGYLVDFWWPAERVVVELDGFHWHKTRRSFEEDRRKDARLQVAGIRPLRLTERRLRSEPRTVLSDVIRMLSGARAAAASGR